MNTVKITNLIKFYTLLLLYRQSMHGYELIKQLEICTGKKISASHVYPFLDILKKNKIIELKKEGNREKKEYNLTKEGKFFTKKLIDKFAQLIQFDNKKIKICVSCGCKLIDGEYKEKIDNKIYYFCCKYCAKNYKS
ncbi:MAG: PadR family transcriptional regulator [Nanoarchaeota archaeon]